MKGAMRLLRSSRTAVVLLLVIAFWAAGSTLPGVSPAWRIAGAAGGVMLAANIAACTWSRLRGKPILDVRRASDLALHVALILILAAMLLKWATAVTTVSYVFPNEGIDSFDDPADGRPVALGFVLRLREFRESFYPARLMVRIVKTHDATGTERELVEGRPLAATGSLRLETRMDGERLMLLADGQPHEVTRDTVVELGGWRIVPLAYRRDIRNAEAGVEVLEGGQVVRQGIVAMNERFVHRGTRLTLTGWGRDEHGNAYVSMQAVRDPFEPLFWLGAILFCVASAMLMLAKGRGLSLRKN